VLIVVNGIALCHTARHDTFLICDSETAVVVEDASVRDLRSTECTFLIIDKIFTMNEMHVQQQRVPIFSRISYLSVGPTSCILLLEVSICGRGASYHDNNILLRLEGLPPTVMDTSCSLMKGKQPEHTGGEGSRCVPRAERTGFASSLQTLLCLSILGGAKISLIAVWRMETTRVRTCLFSQDDFFNNQRLQSLRCPIGQPMISDVPFLKI